MEPWLERLQGLLLADADADELMLSSSGSLVLCSQGRTFILTSPPPFASASDLLFALQEFAFSQGVRLDPYAPSAGGFLQAHNLRWHCLIPPASPEGPVFIIRRHRFAELSLASFAGGGCLQLEDLFKQRATLLICGPTGSGKTSLLALLLQRYAADERVVVIEDFAELPLSSAAWLRLVARPPSVQGKGGLNFADLLMVSMRLRPDRLILGELRGDQLRDYGAALTYGHTGTVATLHASSLLQVEQRFAAALGPDWQQVTADPAAGVWCAFLERGRPPQVSAVLPLCPQDDARRTMPAGRCQQDDASRTMPAGLCPQDDASRTMPAGRCQQDYASRHSAKH